MKNHLREYRELLEYSSGKHLKKNSAVIERREVVTRPKRYHQLFAHRVSANSPGTVRLRDKSGRRTSCISMTNPTALKRHTISPLKPFKPISIIQNSFATKNLFREIGEIEKYKGHYMNGKRHGKGVAYYANGDQYKGEWNENVKTGYGTYLYSRIGLKYEGEWKNDKRHGHGSIFFENGDHFQGSWECGELRKNEVMIHYANGDTYEGFISRVSREGTGTMNYHSLQLKYTGKWANDGRIGVGVLEHRKFFFEGTFKNDSAEGPGVFLHRNAIETTSKVDPLLLSTKKILKMLLRPAHFSNSRPLVLTYYMLR